MSSRGSGQTLIPSSWADGDSGSQSKLVFGAGQYAVLGVQEARSGAYPLDSRLVVFAGTSLATLLPVDESTKDFGLYNGAIDVPGPGFYPVLLGEKDAITFVWREGYDDAGTAKAELVVRRMGPNATWLGETVRIKNPDFRPTSLVRTGQGLALIGQSSSAKAGSTCQPLLLMLADDGTPSGMARNLGDAQICDDGEVIAAHSQVTTDGVTSPGNTVVAWSSGGKGYYRLLGKHLCD